MQATTAQDVARDIEEALYEKHGRSLSKEYKAAGRALSLNFRRNSPLRRQLMSEELDPGELVRMGWQQLSTEERKAKDGKLQAKLMRQATLHDGDSTTGEYTCSQCQSKACNVLDAGRRDVGKCETWGAKSNEDRGRVITCLSCNHRWELTGLM